MYENNGVLKRDQVSDYLKNLGQDERKILRELGVKFGRYHVFLYRLIKPEAVSLRTLLWKNFHQKYFNLKPPTFGLNFIEDKDSKNKNFMLLCGFEKFDNFLCLYFNLLVGSSFRVPMYLLVCHAICFILCHTLPVYSKRNGCGGGVTGPGTLYV